MSLNSNALIDKEYYYRQVGYEIDNTNRDDTQYEQYINQASQFIETHCNRKFITGSVAEIFDGNDHKDYYVKYGRITDTPVIAYWDGDSWENLDTDIYDITYTTGGRVYFTDGNVFSEGKDNWRVTYSYGYTLATVPDDLKMACVGLIRFIEVQSQKMGITYEAVGNNITTYDIRNIPATVMDVLNRYRSFIYG